MWLRNELHHLQLLHRPCFLDLTRTSLVHSTAISFRMQMPLKKQDVGIVAAANAQEIPALCCSKGGCTDSRCATECCKEYGISVNFLVKSVKRFYDSHFYLYKMALPLVHAQNIQRQKESIGEVVDVDAVSIAFQEKFQFDRIKNIGQLKAALDELEKNGGNLPRCRVCATPPSNTRIYVDHEQHPSKHFHGLLQPLNPMSRSDYGKLAMAIDGWGDCPFFAAAGAEPNADENCDMPPPTNGVVGFMVDALDQLLHYYLWQMVFKNNTSETPDLFEISDYIVMLCTEPMSLVDTDVPEMSALVEYNLACLLFDAVKRGFIDAHKKQYGYITTAIANSLDLDPSHVFHAHPYIAPSPADDDKTCRTTVLYGNVVPYAIEFGHTNTGAPDINVLAEKFVLQPLHSTTTTPTIRVEDSEWVQRIQKLREGFVVVRTPDSECRVSLSETLQRFFRAPSPMNSGTEEISLKDLAGILAKQNDKSIANFIHQACSAKSTDDLHRVMQLLVSQQGEERGHCHSASSVFQRQGEATIVSSAASVVAVVHCDPDLDDYTEFGKVHTYLQENDVIADFIVAYLSCRLRLRFKGSSDSLPLASRALLIVSTSNEYVEDNLSEIVPHFIRPPMLHHTVYFAVFDLKRKDIGHAHGVALALQMQKGIHIARAAIGLRSSFIVWFIDDGYPFDLASAIHRESNEGINKADAIGWARHVLNIGHDMFMENGLSECDDPKSGECTALKAQGRELKRMMIVSWNDCLHHHATRCTKLMLEKSGVVHGSTLTNNFKISRVDTKSASIEKLDG
eukprot:m.335009 g.335009  ORF g.335009 m.335009 type:complete len:794 (+) comp20519_c0_seq2:500-2881(+)